MKTPQFKELEGRSPQFFILMIVLAAIAAVGIYSAFMMHHEGHIITGMTNRIVWGTPHVFAVFLIVAASGALNVASIASVFGRKIYKPLSPLSMVLSLTILVGGLMILILDLGRPEHLIDVPLAQFFYNSMPSRWSQSVFGWNMILYTGFMGIVLVYLWFSLERRFNKYAKTAGLFAFVWRLALTTGTGLIFGFLVARPGYDAAMLAPMFIVLSFAYGLAFFCLMLIPAYSWSGRELGDAILNRMKTLLGIFAAAGLYFVFTFYIAKAYSADAAQGVISFLLFGDNNYSTAFWFGQVLLGGIIPIGLTLLPWFKSRGALIIASIAVILGGLSQMYVTIIGTQAYPMPLFPGKVVESVTNDGGIAPYSASIYEILLGLGGIAVAILLAVFAMNVLRILPASLADKDTDPHHTAS
jgi:molybdopterin-containing oxidoreductase family membrane subunit